MNGLSKGFSALAVGSALCFVGIKQFCAERTDLIAVLDFSRSTEAMRKQQCALLLADVESAGPNTFLTVLRMGSETEELFSGSLDDTTPEKVLREVSRSTAKSDPTPGTNFAKMAHRVEAHFEQSCARWIDLRVYTDGGDDFGKTKEFAESYTRDASAIGSNRRLRSEIFYGVAPEFREAIRREWGGTGSKLQLLSPGQEE